VLLNERQPAAPGADHHADLLFLFLLKIVGNNSCIAKRFTCRSQRQGYGSGHVLSIFGAELGLPVEILHLRGDLYRRLGNVKRLNSPDATGSVLQSGPKSLAPNSDRSYTPHAGDDYAAGSFKIA
jgi:hypothetical protein